MEKGIRERQNESISIDYLAAQKRIYSESKRYDICLWIISVLIPIVYTIFEMTVLKGKAVNDIKYIIPIVSLLLYCPLKGQSQKLRNMAADIQQHFDLYVYKMNWNTFLFGKKKSVENLVKKKANLLKIEEKNDLKNWYDLDDEIRKNNEEILLCQLQNIGWDINSRKYYKTFNFFVLFAVLGILVLICYYLEYTVPVFFQQIWIFIPFFKWMWDVIQKLNININDLENIFSRVKMLDNINMYNLQFIQSYIYMHRKSCHKIPDCFYDLIKGNNGDKKMEDEISYLKSELGRLSDKHVNDF